MFTNVVYLLHLIIIGTCAYEFAYACFIGIRLQVNSLALSFCENTKYIAEERKVYAA